MTPREAKEIIRKKLVELNLPAYKLSAKTISFSDLARGSMVFVKIHGWQPNPIFRELDIAARHNDFRIDA